MLSVLPWIVLALPLVACIVLMLWPTEPDRRITRVIAVGSVAAAFALVIAIFVDLLGRDAEERTEVTTLWEWAAVGDLEINLALQVDQLSTFMMLIITGVGSLIIFYSMEYMEEDRDYRRYFAEMTFFVFSMLLLVLAANYLFLIVGWAFVGLASYLLIGYYYDRPSAVAASKKAFVVNVIGDVGMVLAAFLLIRDLGTLEYTEVFATAEGGLGDGSTSAEAVGFLLFVGAAAKSAQIPLHTWLPDAMEGPTPVSALIHAATMVTAGVYMVARSNALYELAPYAAGTIAVVGAITLFMAATIATVQDDIKRVLAWSTVSQIGYMMVAAGLGLYGAAMFHMMTHAFFKACLFLSAGIVIHAMLGEQSLDRMGNLRGRLRAAFVGMLVGALAISGIPPFSGFFSKDEILAYALAQGTLGVIVGIVGILGAGLTAFYMFRLVFRAFYGPDPDGGYNPEPHVTTWVMAAPVLILAFLATFAGWIQVPQGWKLVDDWLDPVVGTPDLKPSLGLEAATSLVSVALCVVAIGVAWWLFGHGSERRLAHAKTLARYREVLHQGYYFDWAFEKFLIEPGRQVGAFLRDFMEPAAIQGSIRSTVVATLETARGLSFLQAGLVRLYVFTMIAGLAIVGVIFILVGT